MTVAQKCKPLLLLLLLIPCLLPAYSPGVTLGTWGFPPDGSLTESGTYGHIGGTLGITRRIEAEVFSVFQITPQVCSNVYAGAAATVSLVAPRQLPSGEPVFYLNTHLSIGYLQQLGKEFSPAVFARITPMTLGGPDYKLRERAGSFGVLYDINEGALSVFWNIFFVDFY